MIDAATGELTLGHGTVRIGPTTRSEELRSAGWKLEYEHPPYATWSTRTADFGISAYFRERQLCSVNLASLDERFGTSWSDWSEAHEEERRRFHDRLLLEWLGHPAPWAYTWGQVESLFDPRSAGSWLVIRFQPT